MRDRSIAAFNFWPPIVDAIFLLLIFMVFFMVVQHIAGTEVLKLYSIRAKQETFSDLFESEFRTEIRDEDIVIAADETFHILSFGEKVLFPRGSAVMYDKGENIMLRLAQVFNRPGVANSFSDIQVEGHTDSDPIRATGGIIETNWELSAMRAVNVTRFLVERGNVDPNLFSATGYSYYRGIASNDTDENKAINRRIEIRLVYSAFK